MVDRVRVHSLNCRAPSSNSAGDAEHLHVSGHFSSGALLERRDMAQESLLQMLEELASKVRSFELEKRQATAKIEALERERNEAVATAQGLRRENTELISLITLAGKKVDEILKIGANDNVSQPQAVSVPMTSTFREQLGEFSADPEKEPKERSVRAWRSD